jgi:hypothetical protein
MKQMKQMKIWILRRSGVIAKLDETHGFVVRASSAYLARMTAADSAGDEGPAVWRDPKQSSCRALTPAGRGGVVLRDFNNG